MSPTMLAFPVRVISRSGQPCLFFRALGITKITLINYEPLRRVMGRFSQKPKRDILGFYILM